jgi:hypothetical protein
MSGVLQTHVGTIDLLDFDLIGEHQGRDFLPYPFMFTQPTRFATEDQVSAYTSTLPARFDDGDLSPFSECVAAYASADIWVECHVQYIPADTPSVRVMAYRRGHSGYLAMQRPDEDAIDVYTVSPYCLGAGICEVVSMTNPGGHPQIVVPEYASPPRIDFDISESETLIIQDPIVRDSLNPQTVVTTIPIAEVTAYGTVQSHWRPARRWGLDRGKSCVVWIRVRDDGEYIHAPDFSHAVPLTQPDLEARIDGLIAEDVAALREMRELRPD